jgi:hypothetical protein
MYPQLYLSNTRVREWGRGGRNPNQEEERGLSDLLAMSVFYEAKEL